MRLPMKTITLLTILGMAALATAQEKTDGPGLAPGGAVKIELVKAATWIQGAAPEQWEDGKVYIFECWATWCGPCIAVIPHVNELHKKYVDQGLRVCGMNVWEDGEDKVTKFVKDKGDGMAYPVAYTGKGSAFETEWLKAAGVRGIPHAFVVKGGKYLFGTHPSNLTEETIEALLAGGDAEKAAVEKIGKAAENRGKLQELAGQFRQAAGAKDAEKMAATIASIEELDPESRFLPQMRLDLAIAKEDWAGAKTIITALADSQNGAMALGSLAYRAVSDTSALPEDLRTTVADLFGKALEKDPSEPTGFVLLACLRQSLNDTEGAKTAAKAAVEHHGRMPVAPFERYAKALEDGESPALQEVFGWIREEMNKGKK